MERPKRARRRKPDTAKADLKPPLVGSGGQGVHREVESEGHEKKHRAVIKGRPMMNRSAKGGDRSSLLHSGEGDSHSPHLHQGVCGRHGVEEERVTSGGLAASPGSTGVSGPISESEVASKALPVVGWLRSTVSAAKAA